MQRRVGITGSVCYSYSASAIGHLDNCVSISNKSYLYHAFRMEEIAQDTQEIPDAIYRLVLA